MLGFSQVLKPIKWQDLLEEGKNGCNALWTGAKTHFGHKNILGLKHFKVKISVTVYVSLRSVV